MFGMLVYVPATIGLTARRKETKWDRAWGEVVYLGYQAGLYLANSIVAGIVGGPSYCSERLYESGRTSGVRKYPYEPIGSIRMLCNTMSAQIALSCIHVVSLLIWIWWIYKIITKLSLSKSEISQNNKKLWNVSVGELMRRNVRLNPYERRDTEGNITPFVHTTSNQQQEGEEQEPERDNGPYIPPPPYQYSYNDGGRGTSPTELMDGTRTDIGTYQGVSPTISTSHGDSQSPLRSDGVQTTSPSTSNYQNSNDDGTDSPLSPTMTEIVNHKMNRHQQNLPHNHNQSERRTSLRRVMDEKEDSKEVVRRALGG
ncbi:hypothetical protein V866_004756 [Kwoniella sp. B9012]